MEKQISTLTFEVDELKALLEEKGRKVMRNLFAQFFRIFRLAF